MAAKKKLTLAQQVALLTRKTDELGREVHRLHYLMDSFEKNSKLYIDSRVEAEHKKQIAELITRMVFAKLDEK